ncbi:hypothetical protein [Kingella negevensis]|uniref:hypothetical protein n=1 Tax=Kingella negevensis TaxID=1522312 RepID=UPI0012FDB4BF|nr:hypothetical protein [Kingella negevensis]
MNKLWFLVGLLTWCVSANAVDIQRWHTKSGTEVLLMERHELPMIDFVVAFRRGLKIAQPESEFSGCVSSSAKNQSKRFTYFSSPPEDSVPPRATAWNDCDS